MENPYLSNTIIIARLAFQNLSVKNPSDKGSALHGLILLYMKSSCF
jgi:hypothetical protein